MEEKTMNTHMCMFTGSELCLCRISRCLCCVIRKKKKTFSDKTYSPQALLLHVLGLQLLTPLGKSNCWKRNTSWGMASILSLLTFNILFSINPAESRSGECVTCRTEKIQRAGNREKLLGLGEHYLVCIWKGDTDHLQCAAHYLRQNFTERGLRCCRAFVATSCITCI